MVNAPRPPLSPEDLHEFDIKEKKILHLSASIQREAKYYTRLPSVSLTHVMCLSMQKVSSAIV